MYRSDLHVDLVSKSLSGAKLDVLITGSIGAVESVRFVRSLRRLGAEVFPWLTEGGRKFVTHDALAWAAGGKTVVSDFSGISSHIAQKDALVIAPCSASMIAKIASGVTSDPGSALAASYLGLGKKVFIIPNMHDTLFNSPFVMENLDKISTRVDILNSRKSEGKQKFPPPALLADEVSHRMRASKDSKKVLVTMGSTRGYIDDIRYISNYSSGSLGSLISEELYRNGCQTYITAGAAQVYPKVYNELHYCFTNSEMEDAALSVAGGNYEAAVCSASILDFEPIERVKGKIKSLDHAHLTVELQRVHKIIKKIKPTSNIKVGFKLDSEFTNTNEFVNKYMSDYGLSMIILNLIKDVSITDHRAEVFFKNGEHSGVIESLPADSKVRLAMLVSEHVMRERNVLYKPQL